MVDWTCAHCASAKQPAHIQWHHVMGMNAHIRGEAQHPAVAGEALKTGWVMDQILKRC